VLTGIREARRIVRSVLVSNETQGSLELLERVQRELDVFIRRED